MASELKEMSSTDRCNISTGSWRVYTSKFKPTERKFDSKKLP